MVVVIAALKRYAVFESCWQIDQRYKSCQIGVKCVGISFSFYAFFRFLFNELSKSIDLVLLFLNVLVKHVIVYYF